MEEPQLRFPILYLDHRCPKCYTSHMIPINRFGKPEENVAHPIYPITHLRCPSCGLKLFIKWDINSDRYVGIGYDHIQEFSDMLQRQRDEMV